MDRCSSHRASRLVLGRGEGDAPPSPARPNPALASPRPPKRGGPPPLRDSKGAGQRRKRVLYRSPLSTSRPELGPHRCGCSGHRAPWPVPGRGEEGATPIPARRNPAAARGQGSKCMEPLHLCYSAGALVSSRMESTTPLTAGPGPARPGSGQGPLFMGAIALPVCCRAAEGGGSGGSDHVGLHSPPGQALIVAAGPPWVACAPHIWMQRPSRYPTGA